MHKLNAFEQQLLRSVYLVSDLSPDQQQTLLDQCVICTFASSETLMREGETGEAMYVILSGEVDVVTRNLTGGTVVLARLKVGDYFGEQAILPNGSGIRNATVIARELVWAVEISKELFQQTVAQDVQLTQHLVEKGEAQSHAKLGQMVSGLLGRPVDGGSLDLHLVEEMVVDQGDTILEEGAESDAAYFVIEGSARAYRTEDGALLPIGRIGEGQCFGELAVLKHQLRAATVKAETRMRLLRVAADLFVKWHEEHPELRGLLQTLRQMYRIPGDDLVTFHRGQVDGKDAVSSVRHLKNGKRLIATRVIGEDVFSLTQIGTNLSQVATVRYETDDLMRELYVSSGVLVGVVSKGAWSGLARIIERVVNETPVPEWALAIFRDRGDFDLEQAQRPLLSGGDIVCSCMQVTRARLDLGMASGVNTVEGIIEQTGASLVCGSCLPTLHDIVGSPNLKPLEVVSVNQAAKDIYAIRMRPCDGEFLPPKPGQHIVVRGRLEDGWVQRSYTLSMGAHDTSMYEITVKREPFGLFSRWLCSRVKPGTILRGTPPSGTFVLPEDLELDVVFLAAGVGITPGLAMARTQAVKPQVRSLAIHYCASTEEHFVCRDELSALARDVPSITVHFRNTREEGRLCAEDVESIAQDGIGRMFFLCGPESYMRRIEDELTHAGIPPEQIQKEGFIAVGTSPDKAPRPLNLPAAHGMTANRPEVGDLELSASQQGIDATLREARDYLEQFTKENRLASTLELRWRDVLSQIEATGTYIQTFDELAYGAKVAWRNASRCIGRLYWHRLQVRDLRHLTSEEEVFEAVLEHMQLATNGGDIRPVISVFAADPPGKPGMRLWNPQFVRYAGYRQPDGSVIGDPANADLTEAIQKLGWPGGPGTPFDVLPIVIEFPGRAPKWFAIPQDLVLEVPLIHPELRSFADLGLKWYALPAVSAMRFDCGGVSYSCAPFNGWYMCTEIGGRNLSDTDRYDLIPKMGELLGLDMSSELTLWRDRALVELNRAVMYSFTKAGVTMVDHHTAAQHFLMFEENERREGREITHRWTWLVPPISGSLCPVYHRADMEGHVDVAVRPNYFWQEDPWAEGDDSEVASAVS